MPYLRAIDDYLTVYLDTVNQSTGNSVDADSLPTYEIYEEVTNTAIASGSYAKINDAGTTGFYGTRLQILALTGFEVGKCYGFRTTATVNGVTASITDNLNVIAPITTADILATSLGTESYAADGSVPTLAQALFMLLSSQFERSISSTTMTTKKLDGTTTAMTFTLNSATNPTSVTRTT